MSRRGVVSTSNVSFTGSGILNYVMVRDTADGSGDYNATVGINIDGEGSVSFALNNFTFGDGTNKVIVGNNGLINVPSWEGYIKLECMLPFTTTCVVNVSSADSFFINYVKNV